MIKNKESVNFEHRPVILIFDNLLLFKRLVDISKLDFVLGRIHEELPSVSFTQEVYDILIENEFKFVIEHTTNLDKDTLYRFSDRSSSIKWYRPNYWQEDLEDLYDVRMLEKLDSGKVVASFHKLTVSEVQSLIALKKYQLSEIGGQKPLSKLQAKRLKVEPVTDMGFYLYVRTKSNDTKAKAKKPK